MTKSNEKRICLVVGAGEGVGGAIARVFAADGFTVCLTRRARNIAQLDGLVADIHASGGEARAFGGGDGRAVRPHRA